MSRLVCLQSLASISMHAQAENEWLVDQSATQLNILWCSKENEKCFYSQTFPRKIDCDHNNHLCLPSVVSLITWSSLQREANSSSLLWSLSVRSTNERTWSSIKQVWNFKVFGRESKRANHIWLTFPASMKKLNLAA